MYLRLGKDPAWDFDDVLQWGRIGLAHAIETYDPTRGKFSAFASLMIRWEISNGIWGSDRNCRRAHARGEPVAVTVRGLDMTWVQALAEDPVALIDAKRKLASITNTRDRLIIEQMLAGRTLQEIGKEVGLSFTRVQVLRDRALKRLGATFHCYRPRKAKI